MKKRMGILAVLTVFLAGCGNRIGNKTVFDTTFTFTEAMIHMPNGRIITGAVEAWCDYEGDQIQVTIEGVTYLVHSSDCVLIAR